MVNTKTQEEEDIDAFPDLVLPILKHLYRLFLRPLFKWLNLKTTNEFWYFLTLAVFAVLARKGVALYVISLLFLGAALVLLIRNNDYIRNKLFPKQKEKIEVFLQNINKCKHAEVLQFLYENQLETKQIISVLKTRHKVHRDTYEFIMKKQMIESELLEYVINENLDKIIGKDLLTQFILRSRDAVSLRDYNVLVGKYTTDKKIMKAINVRYYFYLEKHSVFKFLAKPVDVVRRFMNFGSGRMTIFVVSLLIAVPILPKVIVNNPAPKGGIMIFQSILGNIMKFLILTFFIAIGVQLGVNCLLRVYRRILCFFAPSKCC
jgi:hypothetical protein